MLIRRARAGSRGAFTQLVERYQDYVFTVCNRVLRDREAAEEAAQDSFLKAFQNLDSFQGQSRFSSWLYTIAYRTALDRVRLKKAPLQALDQQERPLQVADSGPLPGTSIEQGELQDALQAAIAQLKPDDAAVVTLYYLQEQSVKEIADITGLTVTNVKTKLHRSRETLREALSGRLKSEIADWI